MKCQRWTTLYLQVTLSMIYKEVCMSKCGTCQYSCWNRDEQDYICTNEESDNYGLPTTYGDSCELQEESDNASK